MGAFRAEKADEIVLEPPNLYSENFLRVAKWRVHKEVSHTCFGNLTTWSIKGSFSCKWVKRSIFFFHHYSIAYAFRNTHVKFQAGIRKIVEVMNFLLFWN